MVLRAAAMLGVVLSVSACLPSQAAPPPSTGAAEARPAVAEVPAARWHAVLVAGDNSSPAFDNAVDSLRDWLRSANVKSVRAYSAAPARGAGFANTANVQQALRGAAGGDACFVYVTSHGDEHGFFLRADERLFGPATFNEALSQGCGDLPTVVVVSACHSGSFINRQSRQPNRIILTAAAADRTSFGCGADDDYTYYDACFLQQLDGARTWQQLGIDTRACVEALERQLRVPHASRPQMFVGAAVSNLRLPGR